jgi:translation elongation factor EF-G
MSEEFKYPLQYVGEIRGLVEQTFQWGTREGALCEEPLRGVRFKLVDFVLTTDAIHRGAGQLIPAGRRVLCAAQLDSRPRLMEPVYLVETHARQSDIDVVTTIIAERRGQVMPSSACDGGGMCRVKAYLPVVESFGFASALRQATGTLLTSSRQIHNCWWSAPTTWLNSTRCACTQGGRLASACSITGRWWRATRSRRTAPLPS